MPGYAVVDTETTGFSPRTGDRVLEVAVVHLDESGRIEHQWETLLNPRRSVGATHVHGLTADHLAQAPEFSQVADHLGDLLAGRVIVGHNVAFDLRFLTAEFDLASRPLSAFESLCTQKLAASYLPGPKRTLAICCEQAGIVNNHAHSALGDTLATAELFGYFLSHHDDVVPWSPLVAAAAAQIDDDLFAMAGSHVFASAPVWTRADAAAF